MIGPSDFSSFLESVAARTAAPGGGSVAAVVAAFAAALTEMAARYADEEEAATRAGALRARFLELAGEDAEAYSAVLGAEGEAREQALSRAADVPLELAESAVEVAELASRLAEEGNPTLRGDALTAALLASAAAKAAANLVEINLEGKPEDERVARARTAATRAAR
ncbi:MAG: cyclodeaminase/cyclohydrolase family protein [Gaiellaceae bacterium]